MELYLFVFFLQKGRGVWRTRSEPDLERRQEKNWTRLWRRKGRERGEDGQMALSRRFKLGGSSAHPLGTSARPNKNATTNVDASLAAEIAEVARSAPSLQGNVPCLASTTVVLLLLLRVFGLLLFVTIAVVVVFIITIAIVGASVSEQALEGGRAITGGKCHLGEGVDGRVRVCESMVSERRMLKRKKRKKGKKVKTHGFYTLAKQNLYHPAASENDYEKRSTPSLPYIER